MASGWIGRSTRAIRSWQRVARLLTFCPPGPELPENDNSTTLAGTRTPGAISRPDGVGELESDTGQSLEGPNGGTKNATGPGNRARRQWARRDSNPRRLSPTDLQSAPFDRSGTRPGKGRRLALFSAIGNVFLVKVPRLAGKKPPPRSPRADRTVPGRKPARIPGSKSRKPLTGLEPATRALQKRCSTN